MESMLDAIHRLRAAGFAYDLIAGPNASFICSCGQPMDATKVFVLHSARFVGDANSGDQASVLAVSTPCRHAALFRSAYDPAAASGDLDTSAEIRRLSERPLFELTC